MVPTFIATGVSAALVLASVPDPCPTMLSRIEEFGAGLGYTMTGTSADLSGSLNGMSLAAACSQEHAQVELRNEYGDRVVLELSALGYELTGEYAGVGRATWAAIVVPTGTSEGVLGYSAETDLGSAFAEYDFAGSLLASGGDAESANRKLAPALKGLLWKHAQGFALAVTQPGLDAAGRDAVVQGMVDVAVPAPGTERDVDKAAYKKDCLAMTGTCALALFWGLATVACGAAAIKCFAAIACYENDCNEDGKG